jgi:hypothetical protein
MAQLCNRKTGHLGTNLRDVLELLIPDLDSHCVINLQLVPLENGTPTHEASGAILDALIDLLRD